MKINHNTETFFLPDDWFENEEFFKQLQAGIAESAAQYERGETITLEELRKAYGIEAEDL